MKAGARTSGVRGRTGHPQEGNLQHFQCVLLGDHTAGPGCRGQGGPEGPRAGEARPNSIPQESIRFPKPAGNQLQFQKINSRTRVFKFRKFTTRNEKRRWVAKDRNKVCLRSPETQVWKS